MKKYLSGFRLPFRKDDSFHTDDMRHEDPDFRVPHLVSRPKGLEVNPVRVQENLDKLAIDPRRQVQQACKELEQLNRVVLKSNNRLKLGNTILLTTAPAISAIYRKNVSTGTSLPESDERMADLTSVIALLRNLIQCYKLVLAMDYQPSLRKFGQQLNRVNLCAVRIIELTMWLQRYLGIRYQKLLPQEWKDLNSVFFLYADQFDASAPLELTAELNLFKASGIISNANSTRSAASLYTSVQLFGLLDITSWPSKSIQVLEQYLHKHEHLVDMNIGAPHDAWREFLVTYMDLDSPAVFTEQQGAMGCYINLGKLKDQVGWDMDELEKKKFIGDNEKKRLQPHGQVADLADNQGLLNILEKNLSATRRCEERKTLYGSRSVELYSGLSECYRLLYAQTHGVYEGETDSGLHGAAARHSSLLVDETTDELECQWLIINESEGGLLMRTVETRYMSVMEVGQIVAFRRSEEDGQSELQLGYITRLDRYGNGQVDVAIVKMSRMAEAVTVMEPGHDQNTQDMLPGILIRDLAGSWQLILPRYVKYVQGTPAIIKRNTDNIPVRLGETAGTKNAFIMFNVRSPGLKE